MDKGQIGGGPGQAQSSVTAWSKMTLASSHHLIPSGNGPSMSQILRRVQKPWFNRTLTGCKCWLRYLQTVVWGKTHP